MSLFNKPSNLYDQNTFYKQFKKDLLQCKQELIIESPYLTTKRINNLLPILTKLSKQNIKITINTRHLEEHDNYLKTQVLISIQRLQKLNIQILYTGGHHRKLAIIDRSILYEGSLNILSQSQSCEIMRRVESEVLAGEMIKFIGLNRFL